MSRHRVTMSFDLELTDEAAATQLAKETLQQLVEREAAAGTPVIVEGGRSPEDMLDEMLQQNMRAVASMIAQIILETGVRSIRGARASQSKIENEVIR